MLSCPCPRHVLAEEGAVVIYIHDLPPQTRKRLGLPAGKGRSRAKPSRADGAGQPCPGVCAGPLGCGAPYPTYRPVGTTPRRQRMPWPVVHRHRSVGRNEEMKIAQYMRQEKVIATADSSGIRERWAWGLRILADEEKVTPAGGLRNGVIEKLTAEAQKRGLKTLSRREIQWRLQLAKAYPTDSQLRTACAQFESWSALREAGFPDYEADPGEPAADYRTGAEKAHDRARQLADLTEPDPQGTLFPLGKFEPTESTLAELKDYADEQAEMTARFAERDALRRDYLDGLIDAAGDDLNWTWQQAHDVWAAAADHATGEPAEDEVP